MAGTVRIRDLAAVNWQEAAGDNWIVPQPHQVDIWRVQISANLGRIPALSATFTDAERLRGSKYYQERDRQRFAVSRGALRYLLGRYLKVSPRGIEFAPTETKKPFVKTDADQGLQFNLSHSGDWVLLAVAQHDVGTDLEYLDPDFSFDEIIPEHFSEKEAAAINNSTKIADFYRFWTRKEAFLKATGQGLGEHLKITPALNGDHLLPPELTGNEHHWQTVSFTVADNYTGSVTVKSNDALFNFFDLKLL